MQIYLLLLIFFLIGILLFYLIKSLCRCNVVEGHNENVNEYYFYGYFGREETEDRGNYSGIKDPPFYILNNVDFADLKGELSFFKTEFIFDSAPYTNNTPPFVNGRKYGIQYIDKWLIRYKGELGGFQSMQNGAVTGSVDIDDINKGNYIGSGVQTGKVPGVGNKDGNWLSIYGECPNKTVGNKCKNRPCYNNINNQQSDCDPKINRQIDLVNSIEELKQITSNISALYIGTIRLDDLNGSNQGTSCYNELNKIYSIPKGPFESDNEVPIWKNLIDPNVDISKSDAFKLLNNNKAWGCKMGQDKKYTWNSKPINLNNINNICNGKFIAEGSPCGAPTPASPSTPCPGVKCNPNSTPSQNCPNGTKCPPSGCCPKLIN